ncbi:hypothetical protein P4O66_003615 [Electrophorus voltai]|uniref:Nucleoside diphosphate kinase-like domain-containing protein n=1 Tax=Electrophorus voltai TaxID=2609070 RepID=A0AAD9E7C4_9TELE|nr:hypothetical protein P4O66_003615 [Electrophorus voltai]
MSKDGSYLPSLSTLPGTLWSRECLLLTITLLSPVVVAEPAQGKRHTVESTSVKSHVYNSLIAWFMSLVVLALEYPPLFLSPLATHHTFHLLLVSGLYVCGLYLAYPRPSPGPVPTSAQPCVLRLQSSSDTGDRAIFNESSSVTTLCATVKGVMTELGVKVLDGVLQARLVGRVQLHLCFHTVPYMENHPNLLGGFMWTVTDFNNVVLVNYRYSSWRVGQDRFELLGLKWLPALSQQQAQELSPFEPGVWSHCLGKILSKIQQDGFSVLGLRALVLDLETADVLTHVQGPQNPCGRDSELKHLTSGPALVLCLQRVNAIKRLLELLGSDDPPQGSAEDWHLLRAGSGSDKLNAVCGSVSYQQAVQHIKFMFSEGLCCTETAIMKHEQIPFKFRSYG